VFDSVAPEFSSESVLGVFLGVSSSIKSAYEFDPRPGGRKSSHPHDDAAKQTTGRNVGIKIKRAEQAVLIAAVVSHHPENLPDLTNKSDLSTE
jgi:hypothetical protein